MKKLFIIILGLLVCTFLGCRSEDTPYVPTGNGLSWEDDSSKNTTAPQEDAPEQELVLVYYPDQTMNPYTAMDFTNRALFSLIYQGLFTVDTGYNVSPMLCSRYTVSDDMRTYEFYVDNATFSDGTPVTVEDVYESLQAARESRIYKGRFQHVRSLKMNETGGVVFQLETAYENFPILLDIPIVKASEINADRPMGTGPYYLESTTSGVRLRRRTNWWCDADMIVTASSIALKEAQSPRQIRDAFEFSNVGLVCANPGSDSYVDYRCDYELWDCENGVFLYLGCNMESKLFSIPSVRRALTHAIDRDAIVTKYYRDFAHSATLAASPLSPYYNQRLASDYGYDPEKFITALSDNYLSGAPIKILVNKQDTLRLRIAREIGKMMESCGLIVEMIEMDGNDYYYYLSIKNYDIYVGQTRLSANMDLSAFFKPNGAMHYGDITDASIYAMCREALANKGNYINLHKMVADDGRLCPILFQTYGIHATRGLLTGLSPARDNVFYYDLGKTVADIRQ